MSNENKQQFFNSENLLSFIFQRWKFLLVITILAGMASTVIAFLLPVKYKSTVILFPSQNHNISRGALSALSNETKDYLSFGENEDAEQLLQVLKSDAVMYSLEKKFNLLNYYKLENEKNRDYMFKGYYSDLFVYAMTEYESIEIKVYDGDPNMASQMANEAAHLADSIYRQIFRQRAVATFQVVKGQYDSAIAATNRLEDSMSFYRKQGILSWEYQVKEYTKGYSDAEVKGNAQAVSAISDKLKAFQQYGKGFEVIYSELESASKWLIVARQAYMQAKVNAEATIPTLFIVDKAIPADKKTYPIRGLVIAGGTAAALFISILLLLIINRLKKIRQE